MLKIGAKQIFASNIGSIDYHKIIKNVTIKLTSEVNF